MNVITVAGTIGRDAELRSLSSGDSVCGFSVADSAGRDKPTIWWRCSLFGKRAEALSSYLTKGQKVTVSGVVTQREWTDKDGDKKTAMEVRVNEVALQGGKPDGAASSPAPQRQAPRASSGFDEMDSDIPF